MFFSQFRNIHTHPILPTSCHAKLLNQQSEAHRDDTAEFLNREENNQPAICHAQDRILYCLFLVTRRDAHQKYS